jgi:predicted AlkP superfamily pyrophosphatase or phosphodiesterase
MMLRRLAPLALPALLLATGAVRPAVAHAQAAADASRPTLVVFITIDQMQTEYFDRWKGQLTGGLARLDRGGALFVNAMHDHATTETAPGHSVTMSGRFPAHTGIVRNNAGVGDSAAPLLYGQRGLGASPFRFRGSTLIDWLRTRDPRSRALSVSRKDRGAILPLGRAHQSVFWYGGERGFTTSTYYGDTLPTWVQRFNARGGHRRWAGQSWTLLLPESQYAEPDSVKWEAGGRDFTFPHRSPADSGQAARALPDFPWMDELTLELALDGLTSLDLGRGPSTDILAVSLSTTDAVGHKYGPDSREVHDQILRLDRAMGAFLDSLFKLRDSTRIVIALTADHGVAPIPEVHFAGRPNATLRANLNPLVDRTKKALEARGAGDDAFDFEYGMVFADRLALRRAGVNADSLVRGFLVEARRVPGVLRADTRAALARADTVRDGVARRWLHSIPADLDVAGVVTLQPYVYWAPAGAVTTGATHGTPHDYDAHVPVLFWGQAFAPGRRREPARVVDMAPTLAHVLGVAPTERLDGRILTSALRPARAAGTPARVPPARAPR